MGRVKRSGSSRTVSTFVDYCCAVTNTCTILKQVIIELVRRLTYSARRIPEPATTTTAIQLVVEYLPCGSSSTLLTVVKDCPRVGHIVATGTGAVISRAYATEIVATLRGYSIAANPQLVDDARLGRDGVRGVVEHGVGASCRGNVVPDAVAEVD